MMIQQENKIGEELATDFHRLTQKKSIANGRELGIHSIQTLYSLPSALSSMQYIRVNL